MANAVLAWGRRHPAAAIFLSAFALRIALAILLDVIVRHGVLYHPDSTFYMDNAQRLRAAWSHGDWQLPDYPRFAILIAALGFLGGNGYTLALVLTMAAGALAPLLAFKTLRDAGQPGPAWVAAGLVALEPTGLYYSTQLLRDAWFVAAALLLAWAFVARLHVAWRVLLALAGVGIFWLFNRVTEGPVILVLLAVGATLAWVWRRGWLASRPAKVLLGVVSFLAFLAACPWLQLSNPDASDGAPPSHVAFFSAGTPQWPTASCVVVALLLLPYALLAVLYPLPWLARSGLEAMYGAAMLILYAMYVAAVMGAFKSDRATLRAATPTLLLLGVPAAGMLTYLGLTIHVVGPLIRWRLAGIAFLLVVLAIPIHQLAWAIPRTRRPATRQPEAP